MSVSGYSQMNHDEPTNAAKGTTVTSEQEDFRSPGVGEKDLLWDHVGDLSQHLVLGVSTVRDFEETNSTAALVNQIENSVVGSNQSYVLDGTNTPASEHTESNDGSVTSAHSTTAGGVNLEPEEKLNHSDVQGKLVLFPTERKVETNSFSYAMRNITKNMRKSLNASKMSTSQPRPKQIIYDTSDPFSVIFGEVKTEFRTENKINISGDNRENIIGGLAVRRVQELLKKEDRERSGFSEKEVTTTLKNIAVHSFEEERDQYGSEQEEQELRQNNEMFEFGKVRTSPHEEVVFSKYDIESKIVSKQESHLKDAQNENLFKEWDTVSEEQEKMVEDMILQGQNHLDGSSKDALPPPGRWFILLLAGNSTIVKLRQQDFAKYLKLNLAARLSLEYDEVKVNRVVFAPPRLMVNVSVVPSNDGNRQDLDEELDLEDKIFGEEEAPLHKLAETNATLLELSGEEYHVVRFLSLRSQQPIHMEDSPSATSTIINDRHMDIETVIYVVVGGTCALAILITLFFALYRYLRTAQVEWPWKGAKPRFTAPWSHPRHQRMGEEAAPSIGGPLTVIYSGNFVDRTAPSSGSWIDDYQPSSVPETLEIPRQQPVYGFGAISNTALPEINDTYSNLNQESPRFNLDSKLHILGCRPNHFLLPHQPAKVNADHKVTLDVRIQGVGVDNPNYQS